MSTLNLLGLISLIFVLCFTAWAYRDDGTPEGQQSSRGAIIEVWINILIGFSINAIMNLLLLPLVGAHFTFLDNLALGTIYTSVSIVRGYVIRRWAEARIKRFSLLAAERFNTSINKHPVALQTKESA